jgi:hypothetical protein
MEYTKNIIYFSYILTSFLNDGRWMMKTNNGRCWRRQIELGRRPATMAGGSVGSWRRANIGLKREVGCLGAKTTRGLHSNKAMPSANRLGLSNVSC